VVAVVAVVGVAAASVLPSDEGGDDEGPRLDLVVLGDSFVEHSRDQIGAYADAQGLDAEVMGLGGTAICNWEEQLQDYAADPPAVMVISFAGNDLPQTCFNPTDESAADLPSLHLIDSATQLDPDGTGFHESLPCAPWDTDCPATGEVVVRQTDGIHVTPAGAERYARAIVDGLA